ncbi:MAG: hypothetical protein ABR909_12920 [Candidatus Bathyarchaeia archaeon]
MRNEELCGFIVYSYPPPACYGRRLVLPHMTIQEMNKQLSSNMFMPRAITYSQQSGKQS